MAKRKPRSRLIIWISRKYFQRDANNRLIIVFRSRRSGAPDQVITIAASQLNARIRPPKVKNMRRPADYRRRILFSRSIDIRIPTQINTVSIAEPP